MKRICPRCGAPFGPINQATCRHDDGPDAAAGRPTADQDLRRALTALRYDLAPAVVDDLTRKIDAALAAARAGRSSVDPLPIDTVSDAIRRNATPILAYMGGHWTVARWDNDRGAKRPRPYWRSELGRIMGTLWDRAHQPRYYVNLPAPPPADDGHLPLNDETA